MISFLHFAIICALFLACAGKDIRVNLHAAWANTPLRAEVCEVASGIQSEYFWSCLRAAPKTEDAELLLQQLVSADVFGIARLSLLARRSSPLVSAHMHLLRAEVTHSEHCEAPIILSKSGKVCRAGAPPTGGGGHMEVMPGDHVWGANPTIAVYAEIGLDTTASLVQALVDNNHSFIFRHYFDDSGEKTLPVPGYGVTADIKNMEYKTLNEHIQAATHDDNAFTTLLGINVSQLESSVDRKMTTVRSLLAAIANQPIEIGGNVTKGKFWELMGLAGALVTTVKNSVTPLETLADLSHNAPLRVGELLHTPADASVSRALSAISSKSMPPSLSINGNALSDADLDMHHALDVLVEEESFLLHVAQALQGNHPAVAESALFRKNIRDIQNCRIPRVLSAGRRLWMPADAVIWLNDVEKDAMYQRYRKPLSELLQMQYYQPSFPRRNVFHFILFLDASDPGSSQSAIRQMMQLYSQGYAVRFGLVIGGVDTPIGHALSSSLFAAKSRPDMLLHMGQLSEEGIHLALQSVGAATPVADVVASQDFKSFVTRMSQGTSNVGVQAFPSVLFNGLDVGPLERALFTGFEMEFDQLRQWVHARKLLDANTDIYGWIMAETGAVKRRQPLLDQIVFNASTTIPPSAPMLFAPNYNLEMTTTTVVVSTDDGPTAAARDIIDRIAQSVATCETCTSLRWSMSLPASWPALAGPAINKLREEKRLGEFSKRLSQVKNSGDNTAATVLVTVNGRVVIADSTFTIDDFASLWVTESAAGGALAECVPELVSLYTSALSADDVDNDFVASVLFSLAATTQQYRLSHPGEHVVASEPALTVEVGPEVPRHDVIAVIDPLSKTGQRAVGIMRALSQAGSVRIRIVLTPPLLPDFGQIGTFYRYVFPQSLAESPAAVFRHLPTDMVYTLGIDEPESWMVFSHRAEADLDNILLGASSIPQIDAEYRLKHVLISGKCLDVADKMAPKSFPLTLLSPSGEVVSDTTVMSNFAYYQLPASFGQWFVNVKAGEMAKKYRLVDIVEASPRISSDAATRRRLPSERRNYIFVASFTGVFAVLQVSKDVDSAHVVAEEQRAANAVAVASSNAKPTLNIFSVASGHLYERLLRIMMATVVRSSGGEGKRIKFWLIENFLSPRFKMFLPAFAEKQGFEFQFISYRWPHWLRKQSQKQRTIWAYKILFLDVLFPLDLEKVIFVDADQVVRGDLHELYNMDLENKPMAYTPFCRQHVNEETKGFRFWASGFWAEHLQGAPYHISAIYVVDLLRLRQMYGGDHYRMVYDQLSADPNSLANLDQDLPNYVQRSVPIFSLPEEWLWCETWCSADSKAKAKTIDLCNNPKTKLSKLENARLIVPEWDTLDKSLDTF